jgi:hypothetical protein
MKKLLFLAAIAALVACSKTDNFKDVEEVAIDFTDIHIEKNTKASYTNVASLESDTRGFGVFGAKTKQDNTVEKVFGKSTAEENGGAQVTYTSTEITTGTNTTTHWTYSPKRYWDKGAKSYQFYAYAPYNVSTTANEVTTYLLGEVEWDETKGANGFSITGFKQKTTVSEMVDILTDLTNQTNNTSKTNNVNFSFSHILSNINFLMAISPELKLDENDNPVSVNSITLGAVKMDGDYAYDTDAYKWTLASNPTTNTFSATQTSNKVFAAGALKAKQDTDPASLNDESKIGTTAVPGLNDLLFVPQTLPTTTGTEYVVTIEYMIGDETFNRTIKLNEFFKLDDNDQKVYASSWESGVKYNYILVIGLTPIEFDVTGISDWAQTDTYEYVIE